MKPLKRPLLFVSGKGGVGKTTVATAIASQLASTGRKTLLALTDESAASHLFQSPQFGGPVVACEDNLWVARIEPEAALIEYASLVIGSGFAATSLLRNRYARGFLSAVPGLHQWAVLGKAWSHSTGPVGDAPAFDSVVFDAPATGHGLEMLRVPKAITEIAAPGILRRDAERAWNNLKDPAHSGMVLVTLPEELPVSETAETIQAAACLELPVAAVIVNAISQPQFSLSQQKLLLSMKPTGLSACPSLLALGRKRAQQETLEAAQNVRLRADWHGPIAELPLLEDAQQLSAIAELGRTLDAQLSKH